MRRNRLPPPILILLITPGPLSTGLATNLARPGANVTGITMVPGREIVGKYVQIVKEAVPGASRVVLLWNKTSPWQSQVVPDAERAGQLLGLRIRSAGFSSPNEFEAAFAAMVADRADAVIILPDATMFSHRKRLADLALRHQLPALFTHVETAADGGLVAFGSNVEELFRRAANYVDRLRKGTKAGDLPIEQPTTFSLAINLKTAKALGLTISPSLLLRADQVIERAYSSIF